MVCAHPSSLGIGAPTEGLARRRRPHYIILQPQVGATEVKYFLRRTIREANTIDRIELDDQRVGGQRGKAIGPLDGDDRVGTDELVEAELDEHSIH